jgi:hypothetical protein
MRTSRIPLFAGMLLLLAFVIVVAIGIHAITALLVIFVLAALIGGGNLLYGKNSHGAAAQARVRPAQEARNRAIDEARRQQTQQTQQTQPDESPPSP